MNVSNPLKMKGFTLVELLVVLALIATLFGISAPIILRQVEKGNEVKAVNTMKDLSSAILAFTEDNHGFLPTNGAADINTDTLIDTKDDKFLVVTLSGAYDSVSNLKGKSYFAAPAARNGGTYGIVDSDSEAWLADPWGRPYLMLCDYSGDGDLDVVAADVKLKTLGITLSSDEVTKRLAQMSAGICRGSKEVDDAGTITYTKYLLNW